MSKKKEITFRTLKLHCNKLAASQYCINLPERGDNSDRCNLSNCPIWKRLKDADQGL